MLMLLELSHTDAGNARISCNLHTFKITVSNKLIPVNE